MRRISGLVIALTLVALGAVADESSEHLEHLRMMMHAMSSHGPVIPQPDTIQGLATKTINMTAQTFSFSPSDFSVNQGDVVTINVSVPSTDSSPVNPAHILLMEAYIEQGLNCRKNQTATVTFTATTPGTFVFVCNQASCGTGHSSMFGQMVVNAATAPAPTIASINPNSGPTSGGTAVTITGTNFQTTGTTIVRFDTTPATNVNVVNTTTINAVTPAHTSQTVGVRVTNPDGQVVTLPQGFTFLEPLAVASISPNTGSTAGGTVVNINGTGFQAGATVTIGGIPATDVSVVNSTSITAKTPLGPASEQASQPRDVVVTNSDGTTATLARGFTYFVPTLTVTSISPTIGATGGGTIVTINGTGFTSAINSSVTFGGVPAANVTVVDAVTLRATAPAHAAGSVDVVVTFGTSVTRTNAFTYQTLPPRRRSVRH